MRGVVLLSAILLWNFVTSREPAKWSQETAAEFCSDLLEVSFMVEASKLLQNVIDMCAKPELPSSVELQDYLKTKLNYDGWFEMKTFCWDMDSRDRFQKEFNQIESNTSFSITPAQKQFILDSFKNGLIICDIDDDSLGIVVTKAELFRWSINAAANTVREAKIVG